MFEVEAQGRVGDQRVVVALHRSRRPFPHQVQALRRTRAIADDIAQAVDPVDGQCIDACEHRRQGLQVAVDVGNDGDAVHGFPGSRFVYPK
jgi:hypothetical protein